MCTSMCISMPLQHKVKLKHDEIISGWQESLNIHWIVPSLVLIVMKKCALAQGVPKTLKYISIHPKPAKWSANRKLMVRQNQSKSKIIHCSPFLAHKNVQHDPKLDQGVSVLWEASLGPDTSDVWKPCHVQKSQAVDLKGCICGVEITEAEIESGDKLVMKCKVLGCETIWVSTFWKQAVSHCWNFFSSTANVWIIPSLPGIGPVWAAKGAMHQNGAIIPDWIQDRSSTTNIYLVVI